jgi:hypothetical protein
MKAKIEAPKSRTFGALLFCITVTVIGHREYHRATRSISSPKHTQRGLSILFLQAFQTLSSSLHRSHLFWPFHALPFFDVLLGTTTAQAQLTIQLANGNTGVFDILGHASTPSKAFAR